MVDPMIRPLIYTHDLALQGSGAGANAEQVQSWKCLLRNMKSDNPEDTTVF